MISVGSNLQANALATVIIIIIIIIIIVVIIIFIFIIIIIIIIPCNFFAAMLSDGFSRESEWQQFSSGFQSFQYSGRSFRFLLFSL